ncbi:McrB family protein [Moritella sp. F3]|uniref:McrB family protein n=1 Tax=Moritella sp. F3 TaxID=2718882 RepID=UPI001A18DB31|nr:AAA family ATPase [Moritella sp. F3]GIC79203.1 ATP-binding protein [Moritella sp. F1]GIC81109.1 ATP-binding protein [Moritella sp. F3]
MDFNKQFDLYREYVQNTLSQFPVDSTKLNCIAVFKALAELIYEKETQLHVSGVDVVNREILQKRVSERYPVNANARRQEVNKYLSQRFRLKGDKEPSFIEFTLKNDTQIYSRLDEVDAGSKREGYRICDFLERDKLIDFLRNLDLTVYYLQPSELTLIGIVDAYLKTFVNNSPNQKWFIDYSKIVSQFQRTDKITEEQLTSHWLKQRNGVALIKNGITSKADFQSAKPALEKITQLMKSSSDLRNYNQALKLMDEAKEEQQLSKIYNAVLNRIAITYNSDELTFPVDRKVMPKLVNFFNDVFNLEIDVKGKNWFELSTSLKVAMKECIPMEVDPLKLNIIIWRIYENKTIFSQLLNSQFYDENGEGHMTSNALNQILYGPPGTGKTYHSIEAAVKAAEPTFTFDTRQELKTEYDRLVVKNRIRFVTFHQSYGYEEFVEGLSAKTKDGQISYYEKDGIFKKICTTAQAKKVVSVLDHDPRFSALMVLLKGYQENGTPLETVQGKRFIISKVSEISITVQPEGAENTKSVNVKHLINYLFSRDNDSITNHSPAYIRGIAIVYDKLTQSFDDTKKKNYVLIIDEINRGNISKIFGELITLIEPSKRAGADEALSLTLPYSGTTFSVPKNLYIIGTMNTADRSLAMMDTALRRRFDFVEMMPNTALFNGINVKGINLQLMLETMNKRIEVLYDREHTLGHAFFMPVKALVDANQIDDAFTELKSVFKNKIIPLLEEYFFEDWNKIRLVLGDNQKDESLRFITEKTQSYGDIFGLDHGLDSYETENTTYALAPFDGDSSVWNDPKAYIGIYPKEPTKLASVAEAG